MTDVDDGVVGAVLEVGAGSLGGVPGGAFDAEPPGRPRDRAEDVAFGREVEQQVEDEGGAEAFGVGAVSGGLDERGEPGVGDGGGVDREGATVTSRTGPSRSAG